MKKWKSIVSLHQRGDWDEIFKSQIPVHIKQLVADWRAVSSWRNLESLRDRVRDQQYIVPVELGGTYMDKNTQIVHIEFSSYLDALVSAENSQETGDHVYLAQHEMSEMPLLLEDISVPDLVTSTGKKNLYRTNLWLSGHGGSTSPCHFDPFNNLLCQVIGKKRVVLFRPDQSSRLYPAVGTMQRNTSLVDDIDNPDLAKFPLFSGSEGLEAQLEPGDALFIPFKWWHFCESKQLSASVNFWWL